VPVELHDLRPAILSGRILHDLLSGDCMRMLTQKSVSAPVTMYLTLDVDHSVIPGPNPWFWVTEEDGTGWKGQATDLPEPIGDGRLRYVVTMERVS